MYSVTNLLGYDATILKAPQPSETDKSAENLVNNLRTRSNRNDFNPIINSLAERASFNSCLTTTDAQVGLEEDEFELAFDLGKPMMINAIIIAQD